MTRTALLSATLIAGVALGCGGAKKPAPEGGEVAQVPQIDAMAAETPEEKFGRQRSDTVDKMCERLVDCSIADAKSSLPPEELAQLDLENTAKGAMSDCTNNYASLSPRQVVVVRECLGEPTECPEFGLCLAKLAGPS